MSYTWILEFLKNHPQTMDKILHFLLDHPSIVEKILDLIIKKYS